jgi:hypothetical protein
MAAFGHLLPQLSERADDRFDVVRAAASRLLPPQPAGRAFVAVDDAQVLDALSATLVHLLALSKRAFVVVAARRGEPLPDAIERLWREGAMEWLDLAPLCGDDVGELLRRVIPESPVPG